MEWSGAVRSSVLWSGQVRSGKAPQGFVGAAVVGRGMKRSGTAMLGRARQVKVKARFRSSNWLGAVRCGLVQ